MRAFWADHGDPERGCLEHGGVVASVTDPDAAVCAKAVKVVASVGAGADLPVLGVDLGGERPRGSEGVGGQQVNLEVLAQLPLAVRACR